MAMMTDEILELKGQNWRSDMYIVIPKKIWDFRSINQQKQEKKYMR